MSSDEFECAYLGPEHWDWGHIPLFYELPPYALDQTTAPHTSLGAAGYSQDLTLQDVPPQDLTRHQFSHPSTQLGQLAWGQCRRPYLTPSPTSEGLASPLLPIDHQWMVDGYAQPSPFILGPTPPQTPRSGTQSARNADWNSAVVNKDCPKVQSYKARASSPAHVTLKTKPVGVVRYDMNKIRPIGKPYVNKESGEIEGSQLRMGQKQAKRRRLNEADRENASEMRKMGVCPRCKKSRKRCDHYRVQHQYEECTACAKIPPGVLRMPCFRSSISEAGFFRLAPSDNSPHRSTRRKAVFAVEDIPTHGPVRRVRLTQDIGDHELIVSVAQFDPIEGDKTAYTWKNGTMQMLPFCISDIQDAQKSMKQYVQGSVFHYLRAKLKDTPVLTRVTFGGAIHFYSEKEDSLVRLALNLWSASRVIEESWRVCDVDTLGLEPIKDPSNPWYQKDPVTLIMDTQLDQCVIHGVLIPGRDELLKKLQHAVMNFKKHAWFEIYLTIFILLSTIEAAGAHQRRFATRYSLPTQYANNKEMEAFFHGSKILLAHFHFVCRGALPLQILNWTDSQAREFASLNAAEAEFMEITQDLIKEEEEQLKDLRQQQNADTPLFWCGQLWDQKWQPAKIEIEDKQHP